MQGQSQPEQKRAQCGEMPLESVARHLQSGRRLMYEVDGHNLYYQFHRVLYEIGYDSEPAAEGKPAYYVSCYAGTPQRSSMREYRLWTGEYETLKGLVELQPFDIKKFWWV